MTRRLMKRVNCQIPLAKTQIQIIGGNGILKGVSANVVLRLSPAPRVFIDIEAQLHSLVHFKIPTKPLQTTEDTPPFWFRNRSINY